MQKYRKPIGRLRMIVCLIGMLLPMCIFAQQITVQGIVKESTGETVIGASVMEKGTSNGTITGIIMPDDDRLPEQYRDAIEMKKIRFRTLGCWPLTGAIESEADTIESIVEEMMTTTKSERTTRVIDFDQEASMEQKKREGYF